MTPINFFAQLLGFSLIIIPLALLLRPKSLHSIITAMEHESTLLIGGMIKVIFGITILLFYNTFDFSWKTVITLVGWVSVLAGTARLLMPSQVLKLIKQAEKSGAISIMLTVLVILGCLLIYFNLSLK